LGERGYQVVAVEPSGGLAECARLRCRDLANVEVIHGFLEDVVSDQRFDFVVCVDPFFAESEFLDPAIQLFALCQKALKATGTLIVSVGNSLHVPGGAHIEPSRQHVRGGVAPLEALKRSLEGAGFFHMERYVTFPNHAAPQLLVNAAQAQQERIHWLPILRELFCTSEQAEKDMESWWRGVILEGLEEQLAPGWLILAHTHAVHSVLWNGKACRYFVPGSSNVSTEGVEVCSLGVQQAGVIDGIIKAAKPRAHSVTDYKESLVAADDRIDDLLAKETALTYELEGTREEIVRTQERHEGEIVKEQEARRIREAELGLVLKQYHAVGAMCHDMREEGRKLKDMLEELRRRYVASEEWGFALTKRISEAEAELQQARSSRIFRLIEKVKGMFSKRTPSKLSETVRESLRPDERQVQTIL
jgi:SAM-dependent methyltransferase